MSRRQAEAPDHDNVLAVAYDGLHPAKGFHRSRNFFNGGLTPLASVFGYGFGRPMGHQTTVSAAAERLSVPGLELSTFIPSTPSSRGLRTRCRWRNENQAHSRGRLGISSKTRAFSRMARRWSGASGPSYFTGLTRPPPRASALSRRDDSRRLGPHIIEIERRSGARNRNLVVRVKMALPRLKFSRSSASTVSVGGAPRPASRNTLTISDSQSQSTHRQPSRSKQRIRSRRWS